MRCPKCSTFDHKVTAARAADATPDGTVHRIRKCACGHAWRTQEFTAAAASAMMTGAATPVAPPPLPQAPLATPLSATMIDIEAEMEGLLPDAIVALRESVQSKDPSRVRAEAAWRVVADRREYRMGLAKQAAATGDTPEDPGLAQLASILRLVPPAAGA